jgi:hypothetical protein
MKCPDGDGKSAHVTVDAGQTHTEVIR